MLPGVLDPFAGGGAIPLEAQRLGLEAHASDLNPLAVLINKALIEIPPKFSGREPVFPGVTETRNVWQRAEGLAEDIRAYGQWMRDEAERRIGHLYPTVVGPDGTEHRVIAWIWARTVTSPNPANPIEVPLVRSWWLSKKKGKEAWVKATVVNGQVQYQVIHDANGPKGTADGTVSRTGGIAVGDGTPIDLKYIRAEAQAGRMGAHLMAIVAEGNRGRLYLSPVEEQSQTANLEAPRAVPDGEVFDWPGRINVYRYGMTRWADLFTNRQLVALTTLSDLVTEAREKILQDAIDAGMDRGERLENGGVEAEAYADAVATYVALAVSRMTDYNCSLTGWNVAREGTRGVFARQAIPMVWDFVEVNPFSGSSGNYLGQIEWISRVLDLLPAADHGITYQLDAAKRTYSNFVISTDPPYYDNIGYSDLSDFFYVWLRRSLADIHSSVVGTMLTPKAEELVANPYRHGGKQGAEQFFVDGFNDVFARIRAGTRTDVPLTVYYAYKQQDSKGDGTASTGWHTLLDGLIGSGWEITATWPLRSERGGRMLSVGTNALASSIVLACRPRPKDAPATTRRAFVTALRNELPEALRTLIQGSIAPVDLAQAAIGPGISVFSRYSRVREADGTDMSVKDALLLINATLDEVLGEQESDFDPDTRFAIKWYRQYGWKEESAGIADQLARSSDTSIGALERGGIFEAKGGKARLLPPSEMTGEWNALDDDRVSIWETTVRLAALMKSAGADAVARLLPGVQARVDVDAVKELGFLLFHEAEKKKDTDDAILFNALVSAWGDVNLQARHYAATLRLTQGAFDLDGVED